MTRLLETQASTQTVFVVADILQAQAGANPHLWYKPETSLVLAKVLTRALSQKDPANKLDYQHNYVQFQQQFAAFYAHIQTIKQQHPNVTIIATEPIFNYLAESLGFKMLGLDFQLSVMNGVPPFQLWCQ